jgi:hypothetical protein
MALGDEILRIIGILEGKSATYVQIAGTLNRSKQETLAAMKELVEMGYLTNPTGRPDLFKLKEEKPAKKKKRARRPTGLPQIEVRLQVLFDMIKRHGKITCKQAAARLPRHFSKSQIAAYKDTRLSGDFQVLKYSGFIDKIGHSGSRNVKYYAIKSAFDPEAPRFSSPQAKTDAVRQPEENTSPGPLFQRAHSSPQVPTNPDLLQYVVVHASPNGKGDISIFTADKLQEWIDNGDIKPGDKCLKVKIIDSFLARAPKGVELDKANVEEMMG